MNKSKKWRIVNTLIMNIPVAACISLTAQLLAIGKVIVPLFFINFTIAYILSFFIGMYVPSVKWGMNFAKAFKAKPSTLPFGLCINVVVNLVYVTANEIVLTYFNVAILNKAPLIAVVFGILETFIPIYIVGYIVSFLWNKPSESLTDNLINE